MHQNHGNTGYTTGIQIIGAQKQVKTQSKDGAAQQNIAEPEQPIQSILFVHGHTSKLSCRCPRSSGFTNAPALGMVLLR